MLAFLLKLPKIAKILPTFSFFAPKCCQFWRMQAQFRWYLDEVEQISSSNYAHRQKSLQIFRRVKAILLFLSAHCLHLVFLLINWDQSITGSPKFWRVFHFDHMFLFDLPPHLNLHLLLLFAEAMTFLYTAYFLFRNNPQQAHFILLIREVVYQGDPENYLLQKTIQIGRKRALKSITVVRQVTRFFRLSCYSFTVTFTAYAVLFHVLSWRHFTPIFETLHLPCKLLYTAFYLLNCVTCDLADVFLVIVDTLLPAVMISISAIVFIRLSAINQMIKPKPRNESNSRRCLHRQFRAFEHFARLHTGALLLVLQTNRFIGVLLLAFIAFILPMNAYTTMLLATGRLNALASFYFTVLNLGEALGLVFFHLLATWYTKKLHQCTGPLYRLATQGREWFSWRQQLTLFGYIAKFDGQQRYGITYGPFFGLISVASFTKV